MTRTIQVANAAALTLALQGARGGETILLTAGDYGALNLDGFKPSSNVTIRSSDASPVRATFATARIANSENLTIQNVVFDDPLATSSGLYGYAVAMFDSRAINLVALDVHGSLDGEASNDANGIRVTRCEDVMIVGSRFHELRSAVYAAYSEGLVVGRNEVWDVREGFNFGEVEDVVIDRNYFHDFDPDYAAGDHPDYIQFWTAATLQGSDNVAITNNVMLQGDSGFVQGIFVRAEDPTRARHEDFRIENNLYYGDSPHGITLMGVDDAVIRGNTVVATPTAPHSTRIMARDSTDIQVRDNLGHGLLEINSADVTSSNNSWAGYRMDSSMWSTLGRSLYNPGAGALASLTSLAVKTNSVADVLDQGFVQTGWITRTATTWEAVSLLPYYRDLLNDAGDNGDDDNDGDDDMDRDGFSAVFPDYLSELSAETLAVIA